MTRYSSRKELFFSSLNSFFVVLQAGKGSGRGGTFNYLHLSELAHFTRDALTTVAGMVAAVPPPEAGSCITIESTANGEGNEYHRRWLDAVFGRSEYEAHFFPWTTHPEYVRPWSGDALTEEEEKLREAHGLTLEQIAFRRAMISDIGPAMFAQEYPLTWEESFLASGRPVFDRKALVDLEREHSIAPLHETKDHTGSVRIYEPPRAGVKYGAGVDTSEGVAGGDAQDVAVYDLERMAEVATINVPWPIHVFARKAAALVNRYQAFVVAERNNHGHALLEHWLNGKDEMRVPRSRIYMHRDYDAKGKAVRKPGWDTNSKTRPIMLADLEEAIRKRRLHARDPEFYLEARAFAYNEETGKPEAPEGGHDDRVMSRALAVHAHKHMNRGAVGYSDQQLPIH